ncbi:alpha-ketoacid dehydrogenase subunit beta [Ochrobactrum pecoris]|uniref:Alpha-ketoacid dehydrogenase subunit beta n=1 Tax=Brucella pecoris TaxID=867683 RepID=A0A5C5CCN7_9HYPH|nr:alpha-ketoacid dehydrogenase subunit beta [Brucella pecoris]MBB4095879.1 pyruvate dehydrogenase E1 component beta subunit [Brucella pecoris]NKW82665.1 alpha-ketoacid dehydrogenase subunit beta [Brucella pecoris]TNV09099.1 alpha-ketoacid dehydrogenase subunit beta [Brucella pecoris]
MAKMNMREAIIAALREEIERDPNVILFGEDIGKFGGVFGATQGLHEEFGDQRIFDTPIAEKTIIGAALGMAITGLRPVPELQFGDFVSLAFDEIYNKLGKWKWMHGGDMKVPVTVRLPIGIAGGSGPEHSQSPQALFVSAPGLYIAVPSNAADAKGMLKTAIREDNPVLFFEHKVLYTQRAEVPDGEHLVPLGKGDIKRSGADVTIVATATLVQTALEAAQELAKNGIDVEVIDPRWLKPLDEDLILGSIAKTGRVLLVHEDAKTGGTGAEIAAIIAEKSLFDLRAPVRRLAGPDVPIAQSLHLEQFYRPTASDIAVSVRELMTFN